MGLSLRDQLLQAGLIDPNKAREAKQAEHRQRRDAGKKPATATPKPKSAAQIEAEAKAARDAELNRQQVEKKAAKARRAEAVQLVQAHRVQRQVESDEVYNLVDGNKVRSIPVDRGLREKLVAGSLVVVRCEGRYEIVPADIAARIRERDPQMLVGDASAAASDTAAEDDPYRDYVVPDDLRW